VRPTVRDQREDLLLPLGELVQRAAHRRLAERFGLGLLLLEQLFHGPAGKKELSLRHGVQRGEQRFALGVQIEIPMDSRGDERGELLRVGRHGDGQHGDGPRPFAHTLQKTRPEVPRDRHEQHPGFRVVAGQIVAQLGDGLETLNGELSRRGVDRAQRAADGQRAVAEQCHSEWILVHVSVPPCDSGNAPSTRARWFPLADLRL
jgi:hypothetical protein